MFVNVALNIPSDKLFTYAVPGHLQQDAQTGKRVFVPFGRRKRTGFIVTTLSSCNLEKIKSINEILDEEPLFSEADLNFYKWIANYFIYPLGKTIAELIPTGAEKKDFQWITPIQRPADINISAVQKNLLSLLLQYPQGLSLSNLTKTSELKNVSAVVNNLQLSGLLRVDVPGSGVSLSLRGKARRA